MKIMICIILLLIVIGCSSTNSTSQNIYWNPDGENAADSLEQMLIEASKNQ